MSSGVITVSLAANPSATERTAKITINGIEQQLTQAEVIDADVTLTLVDDEIEIEFSGILQWSPDLVTWEDVELQPVKPYRFAPSKTARMFFRAREQ